MKSIYFLITVSTFLFLANCSSNKKTVKKEIPTFTVEFGKSGGFTNLNPIYFINSKGEVFKLANSTSDPKLLKTIPSAKTDSINLLITDSKFMIHKVNYVSNMYNYIEITCDSATNKIKWHDDNQISPEIKKLHMYLQSIIKN